ncbi:MAG: FkbM family methyltransferase [Geminicoccaceae bacterium]|nr:FkbM family methyltransferase [Geminicoccaceae bacterium]
MLLAAIEDLVAGTRFDVPARLGFAALATLKGGHASRSFRYKRAGLAIMRRVLAPDSNTVDVGAHRGFYLAQALRLSPHGRHLAIEPIRELAAALRRHYPRAEVHAVALADRCGEVPFFRHARSAGLSSLVGWDPRGGPLPGTRLELVPVRTLDALVPPDLPLRFLKIDGMGAHDAILSGARATLARWRPFVFFYHRVPPTADARSLGERVWAALAESGLRLSDPDDWLAGRPALDRAGFLSCTGHGPGSAWCFLAHP